MLNGDNYCNFKERMIVVIESCYYCKIRVHGGIIYGEIVASLYTLYPILCSLGIIVEKSYKYGK